MHRRFRPPPSCHKGKWLALRARAQWGLFMRRGLAGIAGAIALVLALTLSPGKAAAQPLLGYVAAKNANPKRLAIFRQGLSKLGYVEGKTIRIDEG